MIYLYLFGTCFHFIYVFMIIGNYCESNCRFMVLGTLVLASMIMIGLKFYIGWRMKNWISKD